jgi:hypothetical protein
MPEIPTVAAYVEAYMRHIYTAHTDPVDAFAALTQLQESLSAAITTVADERAGVLLDARRDGEKAAALARRVKLIGADRVADLLAPSHPSSSRVGAGVNQPQEEPMSTEPTSIDTRVPKNQVTMTVAQLLERIAAWHESQWKHTANAEYLLAAANDPCDGEHVCEDDHEGEDCDCDLDCDCPEPEQCRMEAMAHASLAAAAASAGNNYALMLAHAFTKADEAGTVAV